MTDHIQIGDVSPRVRFIANGVDTEFPFGFPIFKDADLKVYVDGVERETGFTVTGAGQSAGGLVTFDTAPADQAVVVLLRRLAIVRTTDFQESGEFRAKAINDELDYQTAALQQIGDDVGRAMVLDPTDFTASITLPVKDDRAGKYLAFDAEGQAMAVAGDGSVPISSAMEAVVQSVSVPAARDALGLGTAATRDIGMSEGNVVAVQAGGALPALDGSALTGIAAGATDAERANILLNAFRIQVVGGLSVLDMIDGVVDEFEDETGVDTGASSNQTYDPTNAVYYNTGLLTPDLVPTMTSNTAPYGVITNSNLQTNTAWYGFNDTDGDIGTQIYWNGYPAWVNYQFPLPKVVTAYTLHPQSTQYWPKTWVFQGSNDGTNYTTLHSVANHATTGWTDPETFEFANTTPYLHYRLYITAGANATYCWLSEIEFKSRSEPLLVSNSATILYSVADSYYPATRINDGVETADHTLGASYAKGVGTVVGYDFGTPVDIRRMSMSQPTTNYASAVDIETSDDNATWTYRETIAGINGGAIAEFGVLPWGEHRYWRIKTNTWVDNASYSYWYLTELRMFKANPVPEITLISQVAPAETQPDEALLVVWEADVDGIALNTDLRAYVTRNGGSTWTQAILAQEGSLSAGRILTGTADLSAQPDGTSMAWKIVTANNKQLRIHGVGLEWR